MSKIGSKILSKSGFFYSHLRLALTATNKTTININSKSMNLAEKRRERENKRKCFKNRECCTNGSKKKWKRTYPYWYSNVAKQINIHKNEYKSNQIKMEQTKLAFVAQIKPTLYIAWTKKSNWSLKKVEKFSLIKLRSIKMYCTLNVN